MKFNSGLWRMALWTLALILWPLIENGIGAAEYPERTIKIICGYSPGGSTDRPIRLLLPFLQKHLKQSVLIENLPGAEGILATHKVFSSAPDGYTLLIAQPGTLILQEKYLPEMVRYQTKDLTHIFNLASDDFVLLSHPELFRTFDEFLETARRKRLRAAISGRGTHTHLYLVMLGDMVHQKFNMVPFEGGRASLAALLGKHVDVVGTFISTSYSMIQAGALKPLIVFSDQRHSTLSQVPIPRDLGFYSFKPFDYNTGILGPPKLPSYRMKVLEEAIGKAMREPEFCKKAKETNFEVMPLSSEEFFAKTQRLYAMIKKYIEVLKDTEH